MPNKRYSLKFWIYAGLVILTLLIPVFVTSKYWIHMLTIAIIYIGVVAGLDLQYGYTGLITVAHGAFFGIGAYSCGILQVKGGMPFWPSLVLAVTITGVIACLIGVPMVRTRGPYYALGSLAVAALIAIVIFNWDSLTGGYTLFGIPRPETWNIFGWIIDFRSGTTYYYVVWLFMAFAFFVVRRLANSRIGRALIAIRQDEELAEANGVNLLGYKLLALVTGSCLAAIGGGLYASYMGAIEPAIAGFDMGFTLLVMTIIGGPTTICGYITGVFFIFVVPEFLEFAHVYRPLLYGLLLVLVIIFLPRGIVGSIRTIHPAIARWVP